MAFALVAVVAMGFVLNVNFNQAHARSVKRGAQYDLNVSGCVNFRSGASARSRAYSCLYSRSTVKMLNYNPRGYSLVEVNGRRGYVWTEYLQPTKAKAPEPVVKASPPPSEPPNGLSQVSPPPVSLRPNGSEPRGSEPPAAQPTDEEFADDGIPSGQIETAGDGNPDLWKSVLSVEGNGDGHLPRGGGYTLKARNWPRLVDKDGKLMLQFPNGKISHCTSATAAGFYKYMADLHNAGKLQLQSKHIALLNGKHFERALNGNTYSMAALNQILGGRNVRGRGNRANIMNALRWAKPGDVLKIGRNNRTGHSTFFQGISGDKVCYWSSNTKTRGVGTQCEPISGFYEVAVSRLPTDLKALQGRLDQLASPGSSAYQQMARLIRSEDPRYQSITNWERPISGRTVASGDSGAQR